jgi:acetylornithine deacetylase/succinyl-diaminopimelate desuccinylase-like protein
MTTKASSLQTLETIYKQNIDQSLRDFFTFLQFESISTDPAHATQMQACASWLENYIKEMGFETERWETSTHPTIFAQNLKAGPDKPTLLIYNHYDVQPVEPLELWTTPPFKPEVRHGHVYARGAEDNKGQCFYVLQALRLLLERDGCLPINVKLCIEGGEEIGSLGIDEIVAKKREKLKADYLAIVDLDMFNRTTPAICLGVRGLITFELELTGSSGDMHSGFVGGIVCNPLHGLVELLSKLRDTTGRIAIPGFYDQVNELSAEEKKHVNFTFDQEEFEKTFNAKPLGGEQNYPPQERAWIRPTLEINGISGGHTGVGFKTVIPAKAYAKFSCRLVGDMDLKKTGNLVIKFLEEHAPKGLELKVRQHPGGGAALQINPFSKIVSVFSRAYEEVFHTKCVFQYVGGSISIIPKLAEAAGNCEVVMVGLGLPEDNIHAPNENFSLDRIEKGALSLARTLEILIE